jgi:hypothetical protein
MTAMLSTNSEGRAPEALPGARRVVVRALTLVLWLSLAPRIGVAQETLWVGRLGRDTAVVESARRTGARITGTIVNVAAGLLVQRYEVELDERNRVRTLRSWIVRDLSAPRNPDQGPTLIVDVGEDSIRITRSGREGPVLSAVPSVEGVVPLFDAFFNNPMAVMDLALREAAGEDNQSVSLYYVGSKQVETLPLSRRADALIAFPYVMARQYPMLGDAHLRARMGAQGMLEFDARETTFKIITERRPWRDVLALARDFQERGLGAGGFSAMSPPRVAKGRVGQVDVEIAYGQPSARGRRVFPDVVPYGAVWRAGANAATRITLSDDVMLGRHRVPAGSYSLWVLPGKQGDTLIVNEAARVWGVSYDASQDLLRVPLRREMLAEHVESLLYTIAEAGGAGRIALAWDDRRLSVAVAAAR